MTTTLPKSFSSYGKASNRNPKHGKSTVNWAGMVSHHFNTDHEAIHLEKLAEVESYFADKTIPGPIASPWHGGSSTILNPANFIKSHTVRVRANAGKSFLAGPYLRRLVQLMEWHKEQSKLKQKCVKSKDQSVTIAGSPAKGLKYVA